jgi:hypothetical protein
MSTSRPIALSLRVLMAGALAAVAATADVWAISAATAQTGAPHKLAVTIKNGKADSSTLRVTQGEQVELALSSDQPAELHLHGYDLTAQLEPGVPATIAFVAKIAGRFPVEAHRMGPTTKGARHAGTLFYVEVYPP